MAISRRFAVLGGLVALVALGTFRFVLPGVTGSKSVETGGNAYDFDSASGETRASVTGEDGTITTLYSGAKRIPRLPAGFSLFPGAEVIEHNRVERGPGSRTLLTMTAPAPLADIARFYRQQAVAAGVVLDVALVAPQASTLAGRGPNGLTFAFSARSEGKHTRAQLTVGQGL